MKHCSECGCEVVRNIEISGRRYCGMCAEMFLAVFNSDYLREQHVIWRESVNRLRSGADYFG